MAFPVTGYAVFILYIDANRVHAPQFQTMDEAEQFANDIRLVSSHCVVSEPYPVVLTENRKKELMEI